MFKKIAAFTDLHLGLKANSLQHNQDCEEFIDWFISEAKKENCDTGIFLGDYHHNRNSLNISTLHYSVRCLEKLGKAFDQFYFFPGNHDLYYRDKRDIHSVDWGRHIPGITIVDDITTINDVTLVPWLVGDEWKKMSKIKSRYVFGHFELPLFYMNAMVQMPNHGQLQSAHFKNPEYVFSGHFHKRQHQSNIVYIGNAFPHNYADAWDDDRGMMILEHGSAPVYKIWPDAPSFKTLKLSKLLESSASMLKSKTYLKVSIDIPLSFEEASFIKETYISEQNVREFTMVPERKDLGETEIEAVKEFQSVDQVVAAQLENIQSSNYDPKVLLAIYNNL